MDIKENLAKNLCSHRKALKLTQLELAEKIKYSDKAVSKWERGEAVPDLYVLKELADLYGTTIDELIKEPKPDPQIALKVLPKRRFILALAAMAIVWLVATALFTFSNTLFPSIAYAWMFFVYAVPITNIVLLAMSSYWGKTITNLLISSTLTWTMLGSIYVSFILFLPTPPASLWMIFLIGIPVQILLILFFLYKKVR